MRVLFFISASGHGKGGHSHSLNMISRQIAKYAEVQIVAIGPGESKVLGSNPHFRKLIFSNGLPDPTLIAAIRKQVVEYKPDVIHCFDGKVYPVVSFCLKMSGMGSYPIVLSKCGGPNQASYSVAKHMVLFSRENQAYYKKLPRFRNANLHLIPNRVMNDIERREADVFRKKNDEFIIFKISRIGEYYRKTLTECIELARLLYARGERNFRLFIVGTIDEQHVYDEILGMIGDLPVSIVTDNQITIKAAAYLHYADAAICTGRGFMEACSLGIPVLAGSVNYSHPILVDEKNFDDFFFYNFSERAKLSEPGATDPIERIVDLMHNEGEQERYKAMTSKWFSEHFDIEKGAARYISVYEEAVSRKTPYYLKDNWRQLLATMRSFYLSSKKNERRANEPHHTNTK